MASAQTLGTVYNSAAATEKLVLLNPFNSTATYLIDNCGYIYNSWSSNYKAGVAAKLDKEGSLYRLGRLESDYFRAGGIGGVLEKYDWNGELLWNYTLADSLFHLHHDLEIMPNGNILLVAWELVSSDDLLDLGRAEVVPQQLFYSDLIIEIDPTQNFDIVWEWRALDHIVQNHNSQLSNYGQIDQFPGSFDINLNSNPTAPYIDWLHINSVDYNEELDQLMLSCNGINEVVIIDHSLDSVGTKGSQGGNANRGGDILYRWGAANNYLTDGEAVLSKQHDAKWVVDEDGQYGDSFTVFNNGQVEANVNYSELFEVAFHRESYTYQAGNGHSDIIWSYNSDNTEDLYSKRMSGVTKLPNKNVVLCEADTGTFLEIDEEGQLLWKYINPISANSILTQGQEPSNNVVFNIYTYEMAFFENVPILNTNNKIEKNWSSDCFPNATHNTEPQFNGIKHDLQINIKPTKVFVMYAGEGSLTFGINNLAGQTLYEQKVENGFCYDLAELPTGLYLAYGYSKAQIVSKLFFKE